MSVDLKPLFLQVVCLFLMEFPCRHFFYFNINDFDRSACIRFINSLNTSPLPFNYSTLYIIKVITTVIISVTLMSKIIFWGDI